MSRTLSGLALLANGPKLMEKPKMSGTPYDLAAIGISKKNMKNEKCTHTV
jgi:hypothetical protein